MMIKLLLLVVVVVVVMAILAAVKARASSPSARADIYFLRKSLFTPAERSFLGVLDASLPPGVRVYGKVRLEDIIGVKKGLGRSEYQAAKNRINRKHVDFLLVRTSDLAPVAGLELDDASHEEEERQQRDSFVDAAFASAGLPLLHVAAQKSYNSNELKTKLSELVAPRIQPS